VIGRPQRADFKVRRTDGTEETVEAHRVTTDQEQTMFERRTAGRWEAVLTVAHEELQAVQRRYIEHNSRYRWLRHDLTVAGHR